MWQGTQEIGVATAIGNKYGLIIVARYRPRGGEGTPADFMNNVMPPGGNMTISFEQELLT